MVKPARLGHADRQTARHGASPRRRCPQARRHPAPHMARPNRVPLRQETERDRQPRRSLSTIKGGPQKQFAREGDPGHSRGDDGQGDPVENLDPASSRLQGRETDWDAPPS